MTRLRAVVREFATFDGVMVVGCFVAFAFGFASSALAVVTMTWINAALNLRAIRGKP